MKIAEALKILAPRCGTYKGPTHNGWYRFKRCPFKNHRSAWGFGIRPSRNVWNCYSCGTSGPLGDLGIGTITDAPREALAPPLALAPRGANLDLPWRPLRLDESTILGKYAMEYLATRGITPTEAVYHRLGFGIEGRWADTVIHPWFNDEGGLGGWQGRVIGHEPGVSEGPKVVTSRRTRTVNGRTFGDGDFVFGASEGALIGFDTLRAGSDVMFVEGPYQQIVASRIVPSVATIGSVLHPAQLARVLKTRPASVTLGWDPGKERDMAQAARDVLRRYPGPVYVMDWGAYRGDWDRDEDGDPVTRAYLEALYRTHRTKFLVGM